jgi:hypothetical protein
MKIKLHRFSAITILLLVCASIGHREARADTCIADTLKVSHVVGRVVALWRGGEEPIPKASIELKAFLNDEWQTKFTATSDDKGFFRIENVPSGKYELHITRENFHSFRTTVRLKASKSMVSREIVVTFGIGIP